MVWLEVNYWSLHLFTVFDARVWYKGRLKPFAAVNCFLEV